MTPFRLKMPTFVLFVLLAGASACQSPTDADESLDVDDVLTATVAPSPASANASTDGKTYRVVRGNNQPDDILLYDWKATFGVNVQFTDKADDNDVLAFPIKLSAASLTVQQATGGIVTTPTGGDTEHYEYVSAASGNTFGAIGAPVTLTFDIWYDLPSLKKEALVKLVLSFVDDDGLTFTKTIDIQVAP